MSVEGTNRAWTSERHGCFRPAYNVVYMEADRTGLTQDTLRVLVAQGENRRFETRSLRPLESNKAK